MRGACLGKDICKILFPNVAIVNMDMMRVYSFIERPKRSYSLNDFRFFSKKFKRKDVLLNVFTSRNYFLDQSFPPFVWIFDSYSELVDLKFKVSGCFTFATKGDLQNEFIEFGEYLSL